MLSAESYAGLPAHFYSRVEPTPVAEPRMIRWNDALAAELGLDVGGLGRDELAEIFAGNRLPPGAVPISTVYAGHQFGQFVPQLGDGRAVLLGEVRDRDGRLREIQLKGSGRTPYSRGGDGRAALGPVLREYLVSEGMHALGLPTTRSLAAVATGEAVYRDARLPGAVLTRVAASHVRVGTFQYFAARGDVDAVRRLADYVIGRHYPEASSAADPYLELLELVMVRQAQLVAGWMGVGFIHGVMNTDNMAISGETIDFGPCAFMDTYDPNAVFSSIDHRGRYAYANQPAAAQWNLARFAETLLSLLDSDVDRAIAAAGAVIERFSAAFDASWMRIMRAKVGFFAQEPDDSRLIRSLFETMHRDRADFTLTFDDLCAAALDSESGVALDPDWLAAWRARLARDPRPTGHRAAAMRKANPRFIPRNHRIEAVIAAAVEHGNFAPFDEMAGVVTRPFDECDQHSRYAAPPLPHERVTQTFCGT